MTTQDELWMLGLLLTLAGMLYLATWFIEGPPADQQDPLIAPVEIAAHPGQAQS